MAGSALATEFRTNRSDVNFNSLFRNSKKHKVGLTMIRYSPAVSVILTRINTLTAPDFGLQ